MYIIIYNNNKKLYRSRKEERIFNDKIIGFQNEGFKIFRLENIIKKIVKLFLVLISIRNEALKTYCISSFFKLFDEHLRIEDKLESISSERVKEIIFQGIEEFRIATKVLDIDPVLSYSVFVQVTALIKDIEQGISKEIKKK